MKMQQNNSWVWYRATLNLLQGVQAESQTAHEHQQLSATKNPVNREKLVFSGFAGPGVSKTFSKRAKFDHVKAPAGHQYQVRVSVLWCRLASSQAFRLVFPNTNTPLRRLSCSYSLSAYQKATGNVLAARNRRTPKQKRTKGLSGPHTTQSETEATDHVKCAPRPHFGHPWFNL